jgi:hypothetical protein
VQIRIGADGDKNCHVTISGQSAGDMSQHATILFFKDLTKSPTKLRLDGLQFAIQEKMGFNLWWIVNAGHEIIMPIESRGGYDFEKIKPICSPEGAIGMSLTAFKVTEKSMSYLIMLDLTKQ